MVLSKIPLFCYLSVKLSITTHVYFNQKNFKETQLLQEFYRSANKLSSEGLSYSDFISNIDIKEVTGFLGSNLFSLMKLIMLEKKIIVFSEKASLVSQFIIGILTLFPGCTLFCHQEGSQIKDYLNSINRLGLPLKIFNTKNLFLAAASIRDLKKLEKAQGYFIGTTNTFLPQNSMLKADMVINIDEKSVIYKTKKLKEIVCQHSEFEYEILKMVKAKSLILFRLMRRPTVL